MTALVLARQLWHDHRWPALVVCLSAATLWLLDLTVAPGLAGPLDGWWTGVFLVELAPLVVVPVIVWHRLARRQSWAEITTTGPASPLRLGGLVLTLLLTRAVVINAVSWKAGLPLLHPFAFDLALARADAALHGGDPWRHLRWFTRPGVLRVLDAFYTAWYIAFFAVVAAWGWATPSARRRRFLTALMLTWAVGSATAVLISSAGPVYYARVTGAPDRYAPLLESLHVVPLAATRLQALLWEFYRQPSPSFARGIAAFPSLHVAMPALYAIATPPGRPRLRWFWWAMTALTAVGSVVLAWHYAMDSYGALLLAAGCWWLAGRLTGG